MYAVAVTVWVKPDHVEDFIKATLDNARNSRTEPLNVRFDVLQHEDDPAQFLIYEIYRSIEGFRQHQQTPHYFAWREAVADWMAQPRKGLKYRAVFFGDAQPG